MSLDRESTTDDYFVTALQIFDYCGAQSNETLRVDALMDKFAPFVKTNKAEYSYLRSLLDPEDSNPEINTTKLASALHKYSESQKTKVDLDESFNLFKSGPMPQDSDSGISTDGFHLLEELQCELREKTHLAAKLRSQLDFTDRQHEEALLALAAERDSLLSHLTVLREENAALSDARQDYEDVCDRVTNAERALGEARHELDSHRKRNKVLAEQVSMLETEKLTLQELLTKSKDECHRINEMYASRQSALLEENETLKTEHADLSVRLQDQEEFMQQIIKEKVLLEMELKDLLNKSNQTQHRLDRSIDVSYTEDQMLTALDTLNADSHFTQESQLLDEESFLNALKDDQGRPTNMSLFDEIRLSFNNSRQNISESDTQCNKCMENDTMQITIGTQTDEEFYNIDDINCDCKREIVKNCVVTNNVSIVNIKGEISEHNCRTEGQSIGMQTEEIYNTNDVFKQNENHTQNNIQVEKDTVETQTESLNNNVECTECTRCLNCEKLQKHATKLESDLNFSNSLIRDLQGDLDKYESNLDMLQGFLDEGNDTNNYLQTVVQSLQSKLGILEAACADQKTRLDCFNWEKEIAESQTESDVTTSSVSTQAEIPCVKCEKRRALVPQSGLRRYLWDPLKCLFQLFAVICFLCAVSVLYGVTRRWNARCERYPAPVPWRWFDAQDLMDLVLHMEYVADVPM